MSSCKSLALSAFMLIVCTVVAFGGTPAVMTYQGYLTDNADNPENGNFNITFSIYDAAVGGVTHWTETQNVTVTDGVFSVSLGSVNPLSGTVFSDSLRYLGVQVGADPEMPRIQLTSTPFAYRIATVDGSISTKLVLEEAGVNRVELSTGNDVLQVFDQDNDLRIRMRMASAASPTARGAGPQIDGGGAVEFFRKSLALRRSPGEEFSATAEQTVGAQLIRMGESQFGTGELETFDQTGHRLTKISSGSLEGGSYETFLPDSIRLTTQGQSSDTAGYIGTFGRDGDIETAMSSLAGVPGNGFLAIYDSSAGYRGGLFADFAGDGHIQLSNHFGQLMTDITNTGGVFDGGVVNLYGTNATKNVRVGPDVNSGNRGRVEVYDSLGVAKAGIYVDDNGDGIVFGDAKTFVSRHPYQTGMEIRYVSLEGPEAAAYHRGTATLVNGSAVVEFPEHFAAVINASGMTVQVTPLSANTPGLAVVEKSADRIVVKELQNGTGSFEFDFTITAVRKGFEDFEVIRPETRYDAQPKYDPSLKIEQVKYRRSPGDRSD